MQYENIIYKKEEYIVYITMNRPDVMNAINPQLSIEIDDAINHFCGDLQARVCIITGIGDKAFSVGNDLKYQAKYGAEHTFQEFAKCKGGFGGITFRFDCYKPIIAAVNGLAVGGGFEMALACDLIIASDSASFSLPEPRVGMTPSAGGLHRLSRHIPYHLAMELVLSSKKISAYEALNMGIINQVVSGKDLMDVAKSWSHEICKASPLALRSCKESIIKGSGLPLDIALATVLPEEKRLRCSADMIEGPKAFAEKRVPIWEDS
ncbi:MAG: enoyl-CoA hydratase-related protein [Desulfovermiculus sp.]|nr:enoyl-CoA hydratase-related protein [Desulfovermiculus sp.]